ncbi:MAG: T9SS type A sorting domain-containing protein, partial [Ignavibacteriaceae bacterium]|nr:T9SS type A sorting domain-containing protein [Ignavibacteriaceae bacterium]MCW8822796.1 T9SS type A sorting domain-containing protein [Ignavibacteriaceae bacterium]MCW8994541.1 T9SS type A sorting domain-containing protein [Psychromonas sp.]
AFADPDSITNVDSKEDGLVNEFRLEQNYPNPFNPSTKIKYTIPSVIASGAKQSHFVSLKIYDVLGNEVATLVNEYKQSGSYEIEFNAAGLSSGIYFYKLQAGGFIETKKMILLR